MIKVILIKKGKKVNITGMVKDVGWSGDENNYSRKIEVSFNNLNTKTNKRNVEVRAGEMMLLYFDGKEIFRGYVFKSGINEKGDHSATVYDNLVYLSKNSDSLLVVKKKASSVISQLCKKFGIQVDYIEDTEYVIDKLLFQNKSLNDIFQECLTKTKDNNGKTYKIFSNKGKIMMRSRENTAKYTIKADNVISASQEESIEDIKTQVRVTKGNLDPEKGEEDFVSYVLKDDNAIGKYGVMQEVKSFDGDTDASKMKKEGKIILDNNKKPEIKNDITFVGNVNCTTGNIITIKDTLTGISGDYYISSDSHSFSGGEYTMDLKLSKKLK